MNENASPPNSEPEVLQRQRKSGLRVTLIICGIVMALGLVVAWNYLNMLNQQAQNADYLPVIMRLDRPLEGTNQEGEAVSFAQLGGKVWVLAYVYTHCPAGCAGVMGVMKELQEEFRDESDLHFVSVTMDPERDTPEWMKQWAEERDMGGDNWWFMTGDAKKIRTYMGRYFRLVVNQRTDPEEIKFYGEWEHEFKLVLVDQSGAIRYYYDVLNATYGEDHRKKLSEDIKRLLAQGPQLSGPSKDAK